MFLSQIELRIGIFKLNTDLSVTLVDTLYKNLQQMKSYTDITNLLQMN